MNAALPTPESQIESLQRELAEKETARQEWLEAASRYREGIIAVKRLLGDVLFEQTYALAHSGTIAELLRQPVWREEAAEEKDAAALAAVEAEIPEQFRAPMHGPVGPRLRYAVTKILEQLEWAKKIGFDPAHPDGGIQQIVAAADREANLPALERCRAALEEFVNDHINAAWDESDHQIRVCGCDLCIEARAALVETKR